MKLSRAITLSYLPGSLLYCARIILSILLFNLAVAASYQITNNFVYATTEDEEDENGQDEENGQLSEQTSGTESIQSQTQQSQTQQAAIRDFIISGKINSVLPIGNDTWLADGNWNMNVEDGEINSFVTKMTWTSADGNKSHTHEFENFEPIGSSNDGIIMSPTDSLLLEGEIDVGTNGVFDWEDVPTRIYFGNGKTMTVLLDDEATNSHFGRQPIYGLVTSFTPCGAPGPSMEVLPRC